MRTVSLLDIKRNNMEMHEHKIFTFTFMVGTVPLKFDVEASDPESAKKQLITILQKAIAAVTTM